MLKLLVLCMGLQLIPNLYNNISEAKVDQHHVCKAKINKIVCIFIYIFESL